MKYKLCLLLAMCAIHLHAQTWISLTNSKVNARGTNIEVLASDASQYKFRVRINGFYKDDIIIGDTTYNKLYIEEYETLDKVGYPELPVVNQLLGFPKGSYGKVTISDITWENFNRYTVYPLQPHLKETETAYGFSKSTNLYNSASYFPTETYCLGDVSDWGGLKICKLRLHPFRYNPSTSQLRVMREFTVKVDFIKLDKSNSRNTESEVFGNKEHYSLILSNYNDALINSYSNSSVANRTTTGERYNFLIISAPQYKNDPLLIYYLELKKKQGIAYKVVSTDDIGTTPMEIKNYIDSQKNCGIEYILLIGDKSNIPAYNWSVHTGIVPNGYIPSDYWYGCMGNDCRAEFAVGRFCVSNVSELHNMINKHLLYSMPSNLNNDWFKKVILVAHKEGAPNGFESSMDFITKQTYNTNPEFLTQYGSNTNVGNNSVVSLINQGVGIVAYRGHGTSTGWRFDWSNDEKEFDSIQVDKLNCPIINPVVFSVACNNAKISEYSCLMEHFTTKESAAVAFLGAAEETNNQVNHCYSINLFDYIYSNMVYRIGDINLMSQIQTMIEFPSPALTEANAMAYLWGGDPTLKLWTDCPCNFSPDDIVVIQNKDSITVSVSNIDSCEISLCSIDDLSYFKKAKNVNSYTFTGVDVPCYICVDKQNYIPYVFNEDVVIDSKVISNKSALVGKNITIEETTITNGGTLTIKANKTVTLDNNFSCELGGTLIIK